MNADLLQQLRDVHSPPDPAWWPPAPGWWLIALLIVGALFMVVQRLLAEHRRLQPWRTAQRLYDQLDGEYVDGRISPVDYLNGCNDLLRRLCVHAHGLTAAKFTSGKIWLEFLDQTFADAQFTDGPGQVLAEQRFAPEVEADFHAFDQLMRRVLNQRPLRRGRP